mgnify:CR=1 FL=1
MGLVGARWGVASSRIIPSPIGPLELESDGSALTAIRFRPRVRPEARGAPEEPNGSSPGDQPAQPEADQILEAAALQLGEYFAGSRVVFDLPTRITGTPFQLAVWAALTEIPYGERASYSAIAVAVGRPTAARAVGAACRSNPLPIVVPCHRVVGADGSLTGYAGGAAAKSTLLRLEARTLEAHGSTAVGDDSAAGPVRRRR